MPKTCRTETFMSGRLVTSCGASAIASPWPQKVRGAPRHMGILIEYRSELSRKNVRRKSGL
jgi:hypothetical protein